MGFMFPTAIVPGGNLTVAKKQNRISVGTPTPSAGSRTRNEPCSPLENNQGEERVQLDADGNLIALQPGEATIQGTIPGLASDKGFLFIDALGRVGPLMKMARSTGMWWCAWP